MYLPFRAARASVILMKGAMTKRHRVTVLYASETGKSERFAGLLGESCSSVFNTRVICMKDYEFSELYSEELLFIVTSTFGNGEAPENGEVIH